MKPGEIIILTKCVKLIVAHEAPRLSFGSFDQRFMNIAV